MSFSLGLTGSIGMGKSTTARMFADAGCDLWDADAAVRRLYAPGGAAVAPLQALFPAAVGENGVDREALKAVIDHDPQALKAIEKIVHPLVADDRERFRQDARTDIVVFDIPLLFETGGEAGMDGVACVTVAEHVQRARVLARGTMTEAQFEAICDKQMPNAEKCARSDFVIVTDTLDHARAQVQDIVRQIRAGLGDA